MNDPKESLAQLAERLQTLRRQLHTCTATEHLTITDPHGRPRARLLVEGGVGAPPGFEDIADIPESDRERVNLNLLDGHDDRSVRTALTADGTGAPHLMLIDDRPGITVYTGGGDLTVRDGTIELEAPSGSRLTLQAHSTEPNLCGLSAAIARPVKRAELGIQNDTCPSLTLTNRGKKTSIAPRNA